MEVTEDRATGSMRFGVHIAHKPTPTAPDTWKQIDSLEQLVEYHNGSFAFCDMLTRQLHKASEASKVEKFTQHVNKQRDALNASLAKA
jgi:hypothetical protein